jgi:hypothetical protein
VYLFLREVYAVRVVDTIQPPPPFRSSSPLSL